MATKKPKAERKDYQIEKKRSGRYAVKGKDGKYIHGEKKVELLVKEGIFKAQPKKKSAEAPAAEAPPAG